MPGHLSVSYFLSIRSLRKLAKDYICCTHHLNYLANISLDRMGPNCYKSPKKITLSPANSQLVGAGNIS